MNDRLEILKHGPAADRRRAMQALIDDRDNKNRVLDALLDIVAQYSAILYRDTPRGLAPGEPEKYEETNRAAVVEQAAVLTALGIRGPDGLLDDSRFVRAVDKSGMLERLGNWPAHVETMRNNAVRAADSFREKHKTARIAKVKLFGLGGSAAPHDIAKEIVGNMRKSATEIEVVHADTPNPDTVDENTLVVLCSFSGNTEETLHSYEVVKRKTNLFAALAKGGALRELARETGMPFIQLPEDPADPAFVVQPRESVCLQMTSSLAFLAAVGLLAPGSEGRLDLQDFGFETEIPKCLEEWRGRFGPEAPFRTNPAKQLAFFLLYGMEYKSKDDLSKLNIRDRKTPFILADRNLAALAHEARTQLHERSKLNAGYYDAPEFLHNLVESIRAETESARDGMVEDRYTYYFLRSSDEEPRIRLRLDETIRLILHGRCAYAVANAEGRTPYQRALFLTYFNAHMTTYLALLNGFDPLPVPTMSWIKNVMDGMPRGGLEERNAQSRQRPVLEMNIP